MYHVHEEDAHRGFSVVMERLEEGALLCDIVSIFQGRRMSGLCRRLAGQKARATNIAKACSSLRKIPKMSRRWVNVLIRGDRCTPGMERSRGIGNGEHSANDCQ